VAVGGDLVREREVRFQEGTHIIGLGIIERDQEMHKSATGWSVRPKAWSREAVAN
jgi:hypothetical protein